jgi:hypothetical protein
MPVWYAATSQHDITNDAKGPCSPQFEERYICSCGNLQCREPPIRHAYHPGMQYKLSKSEFLSSPVSSILYERHLGFCIGFEAFTVATIMKNSVFRDVTPCGSCKNRRFGGTWLLLHQGDKNLWTRNKRRFLQEPHGVTSQKTPFFIVTAVKTSNLT